MSKREITFTIEDGAVTCEASGFTGTACEAATKEFTDALGGDTTLVKRTADYYKKAAILKTGATQKAGN